MTARDAPRRFHLLLLLTLALFCARLHAQAPRVSVSIPEGPAPRTFQLFFAQTRIEILYLADVVKDVRTHAVSGDLDAEDAVREMIKGTGLEFQFFQNYSFVSLRPKAEVRSAAPIPTRERPTVALPVKNLMETSSAPVFPQVTVTGTYIPGILDITAPLVITSRREALATGYATVQDAVQKLPMASKAGPGEDFSGNGNFNRGSSINLRGLGSGATLVLVNGRRQSPSGVLGDFVDLSALPITAIDRIELLPDGASALYGSDAIAGVVNIILRNEIEGMESFVRRGSAIGGGDETLAAQLFGTHWNSGKLWGGYQYLHRSDLSASERRYSASSDKTALGGTDFRSFLSSPGNIYDPSTLMPAFGLPDTTGAVSVADLSKTPNRSDRMRFENLLPDRRQHNVFLSAEHSFSDRLALSAEGRLTRRDVRSQYFPFERPLAVPASNPFVVNPFETPVVFVGYRFDKEFGPIESSGRTDSSELFLNAKTAVGSAWTAQLNGWRGEESMTYTASYRPQSDALTAALNSLDRSTAFDPFGHMTSPETLARIRDVQREAARSQINVAQALVNGSLFQMWGGDARVAIGLEHRTERFQSGVKIRQRYQRQSDAFFTEFAFPLLGNPSDDRGTPRLDLSVAGRFEQFSDFGSTANPKIGIRWAPFEWFKVRGSWGTSFKAPRVTDLYDTSQNGAGFGNLPDPASPTGRSIVLAIQGNNPDLQEEKAETWTMGFDFVLPELMNTRLSGTYFSTSYKDRISMPSAVSPIDILRQGDRWQSVITRSPNQEQIDAICNSAQLLIAVGTCRTTKVAAIVDYRIRNLSATESRGFDFRLSFDRRTPLGLFNFDMLSSYYLKLDQAVSPDSPFIGELGTVGNPMRFRGRGTLQWWQQSEGLPGFNARIAADYSASYEDIDARRAIAPFTAVDVQLGFRSGLGSDALANLDMSLYVANVFNHQIPFVNSESGYDLLNSDPYGRVWSVMLQKRW